MYEYTKNRHEVFTVDGFKMLLTIIESIKNREAFTVNEAMKGLSGDTFTMLACIDFLVEIGKCRYVSKAGMKQTHILVWC